MASDLLERLWDVLLKEDIKQPSRNYLGMSQIGHPCELKLWKNYHDTTPRQLDIKSYLAIHDGHRHEDIMRDWLNKVDGVKVTGGQEEYADFEGKFKGHSDGIITIDGDVYIWEHKQSNQNKFDRLGSDLRGWDSIYYAQAQMYMHYRGIHQHLLTCGSAGLRDCKLVITKYDQSVAEYLKDKAEDIIYRRTAPEKLRRGHYMCNWCNYKQECWG